MPYTVVSSPDVACFEVMNRDAPTQAGFALAGHSSGYGVVLASAADNNLPCLGLARNGVGTDQPQVVQSGGFFYLPDWTAVCGTPLLQPRGIYFLDVVPGKLTLVPASTPGTVVQLIGNVVTADTMALTIGRSMLM
jgi:hypothetical protein